jgi:hypothetical protein
MSKKAFLGISVIIFIITTVVLNSCVEKEDTKSETPKVVEAKDQNYMIYTLDGCEYVRFGFGQSSWGGHKGDCSNPIHKEQHQLEIEHKDYIAPDEKHFDCYVNSIEQDVKDKNIYWVETECGIVFQSDKSYKVGEVLKNFKSGKHK